MLIYKNARDKIVWSYTAHGWKATSERGFQETVFSKKAKVRSKTKWKDWVEQDIRRAGIRFVEGGNQ